jgi:hypothetical protein
LSPDASTGRTTGLAVKAMHDAGIHPAVAHEVEATGLLVGE